jgi:1,4-alpha-glucan branching enzyme
MKTGTMVSYAVRRTKEHLSNFIRLYEGLQSNHIDEGFLSSVEGRNNLFSEIDYQVYAS